MGKKIAFDRPPVVETVLGVQFLPVPQMSNAHLGAFWKALGGEWPTVTDAPPLEPVFEEFDEQQTWIPLGVRLSIGNDPRARLTIRNAAADRMIQVQNGRLHFNWLGHSGGPYPRYDSVRLGFDAALAQFTEYLSKEGLGEVVPNQWEVTYVNHIPKGSLWASPADLSKALGGLYAATASTTLVRPETLAGSWRFEIPERRGRLHVEVKHGLAGAPSPIETLVVTLTARGPALPGSKNGLSLGEGLNLGHEVIVNTFYELTAKEAHRLWGDRT